MGLDVIATKDGTPVRDPDLEALDVIRGILTLTIPGAPKDQSGASAIRGKVYAHVVERAGGPSLYDDLTPEQCAEVSAALQDTYAARWFAICAERGYGTMAWY